MQDLELKVVYEAFGFSINSEIPLPELSQKGNKVDSIDIQIRFEDLTTLWNELLRRDNTFVIQENLVMFQVSNTAIFSIQNGNAISVSPLKEYDEDVIRLYLLGTCMGAILLQRKVLPLHGSAIGINGKAYALIGESGAGKSTLASAFIKEGYQLLSDDVIAITFLASNDPIVTPAYPQQKLWQHSLVHFGMGGHNYQSIFGRETKYNVPVHSSYFSKPLPLAGIIELTKSKEEKIEIRKIEKLDRFYTLFSHTFRNFLLKNLGLMEWHFNTTAKIINKLETYRIERPTQGFCASELVSIILNTINKETYK